MSDIYGLIKELREAAAKATQGEWKFEELEYGFSSVERETPEVERLKAGKGFSTENYKHDCALDNKFIALANPQNVLKLLDALEAKSKELAIADTELLATQDLLETERKVSARLEEELERYGNLPDEGRDVPLGNGTSAMGVPLGYSPRSARNALTEVAALRKGEDR